MRPAQLPDISDHNLWFVEEYRAHDAAPFFVGSHFMKVDFRTTEAGKWKCAAEGKEQAFWQRVRESVRDHGVINPINIDRMLWNGVLMDVTRHGGTRMWAARLYDLTIPALIDVKAGEPPENGIPVKNPLELYKGEHSIEIVNGLLRCKAKEVNQWQHS